MFLRVNFAWGFVLIEKFPNFRSMPSETETNEEKIAAAEKIVNSLQDGVEALNEVLENFEFVDARDDEPNYVNIEAVYNKADERDKALAYVMIGEVVTESEIISCIEDVGRTKGNVTQNVIQKISDSHPEFVFRFET